VKISVITTVFNAGSAIRETVESVLSQDGVETEYIVTDGGSTDDTIKLLKSYSEIQVYSEPDDGIYDGMNKGIQKASGDIIALLNAGDELLPGVLEEILNIVRRKPECGIFHGGMIWTEGRQPVREVSSGPISNKPLLCDMPVCHPATFVRREVYEQIGLFDTSYRIAADHRFIHKSLQAGIKFEFLPFFCTYMDNGGISSTHRKITRDELLRTINELGGTQEEIDLIHKRYRQSVRKDFLLNSPFLPGKTVRKIMRMRRKIDRRHDG